MRLAFKAKWGEGFREMDVPIMLRIGTLEDMKDAKGINFKQMGELIKSDTDEFMRMLLYYGYLTACQKSYTKPKFKEHHAFYWYLKMDQEAQKEIGIQMNILFGEVKPVSSKKKVPVRKH